MAIIGIGIILVSSFFGEITSSLGKYETQHKKESVYTMSFLNFFFTLLVMLFVGLVIRDNFIFQLASLPTFIIRAILDTGIVYFGARGVRDADRSSFTFIKTTTIPFVLFIDLFIGYAITMKQIYGIGIIAFAMILLFINHGIKKKGAWEVLVAAMLGAGAISLYKYNITNFNTVEAEQSLMTLYLMAFTFFMAKRFRKENPLLFLKKPVFLFQSLAGGIANAGYSFAYAFAPASIIVTTQRSFNVLLSIISGEVYFKEKHVLLKLSAFVLVVFGIWMLI